VEYLAGLPTHLKIMRGVNKPLLVNALGDGLPVEIWDRPKMGFTFPLSQWMKGRGEDLQAASVEQKFLDRKSVESVWRGFKQGSLHWSRPWALLVASRIMH
jgi:asparagine synthase (glutamine-hydrolysing)